MKGTVLILFSIISVYLIQERKINDFFYGVPLEQSRDSIYSFYTKTSFISKLPNGKLTDRNGKVIKTYFGYINNPKMFNKTIDSIYLDLSSGASKNEGEEKITHLLVARITYIISKKKEAEIKFTELKKGLDELSGQEHKISEVTDSNGNSIGKNCNYNLKDNVDLGLTLNKTGFKKYDITLEYIRPEER